MRKFKIFVTWALLCAFFMAVIPSAGAFAATDPAINAGSAVLLDTVTGRQLYSKNADTVVFPASTTKIMTALLAIEACERGSIMLDDMVTAKASSQYDMTWDASTENIQPGETMSLKNLLYCAVIASANEACNIIAEYVAGTSAAFIDLMNKRAAELGCTKTHFANTHGLHNPNHFTTAHDLALITQEALKHPLFAELCSTVSIEIPATNMSDVRYLTTTNYLINPAKTTYYYQLASGVKTGYTDEGGRCLVSSASTGGMKLISVVMNAGEKVQADGSTLIESFTESKRLLQWAFDTYAYRELLNSSELICEVPVKLGEGADKVIVHPGESISALLENDIDLKDFTRSVVIYSERDGKDLNAPISAGQTIGEISIIRDGVNYGTVSLVANSAVALSKYEYTLSRIRETFRKTWVRLIIVALVLLIILYFALTIVFGRRRRYTYNARGTYTGRGKHRR